MSTQVETLKQEISGYYLEDFKKELWWFKSIALLPIESKVKDIIVGKTELPKHFDEAKEFGWWRYIIDFVAPSTAKEIFEFMKAKRIEIEKRNTQEELSRLKAEILWEAPVADGTENIDQNSDPLDQLIKAQLKNFNEKNWLPNQEELKNFTPAGINLQNYNALILASIIENEEKNTENKPTIAGIFINRLQKGMRLDADVSLCYGLKITYDKCRAAIVPNLNNRDNLYNTRANTGLTPTPISSPTQATLWALLRYKKSDYLFYLHGSDGQIYYGATVEEHNQNKIHL